MHKRDTMAKIYEANEAVEFAAAQVGCVVASACPGTYAKRTVLLLILLHGLATWAGNVANPDAVELHPIPRPVEMTSDMDRPVAFDKSTTVIVSDEVPGGVEWLKRHFAEWYGDGTPQVISGKAGLALKSGEEAYAVSADASGVRIAARTLAGVRWAAYSLRTLVIARRDTFTTEGRLLPTLRISDAPHLAFRAVHLCWIPEMRGTQIERAIRLAAQMKFNFVILEPWGMYRSERHPWWSWPDARMTKAEVRRLAAIGRDLGVTLVPQINVFGHASLSRSCTLKHAVLDLQPQYEPLFEPGGWNWCLSNPETQRVLRELISEIHEDFGSPPYFHLGCDEAQPPSCPGCRRRPYGDLVSEHISGLVDFVRRRGAKALIWHDMLLESDDPRWKGFVTSGSATTAALVDRLPKDVIVCDWEYSYEDMEEVRTSWPTLAYFAEKGFPVVGCPWLNFNAMKPMADFLARRGGFGYIQTTWHHLRGSDWRRMYTCGATAAWGSPAPSLSAPQYDTCLAISLRLVGHDMHVTDPRDTGDVNYQMPPSWWIDN